MRVGEETLNFSEPLAHWLDFIYMFIYIFLYLGYYKTLSLESESRVSHDRGSREFTETPYSHIFISGATFDTALEH